MGFSWVCVSDSSTENELWHVWLAIAHLPPKLRQMKKKFVLLHCFGGTENRP